MTSSIKHKQSISWTFLNDAMAISAKEMPKNHTDKERFAAALSYIQTGILTLLFPLKRRRSSPSPFISHRVLEAVASWILKSLLSVPRSEQFSESKSSRKTVSYEEQIMSMDKYPSIFSLQMEAIVYCIVKSFSQRVHVLKLGNFLGYSQF